MPTETKGRLESALRILHHLRRSLGFFANGKSRIGKRNPAYWLSQISSNPDYWRYPILPGWLPEACNALGITLPPNIPFLGGISALHKLLQTLDEPLREALEEFPAVEREIPIRGKFEARDYEGTRFAALGKTFIPLKDSHLEGVSLYLHGSLADLSFTPFSDIDDLLLLTREAWQSVDHLRRAGYVLTKASRAFQEIDPYQHHGHIVLNEFDLLLFNLQPLPDVIFQDMRLVNGLDTIKFRQIKRTGAAHNALQNTLQAMQARLTRLEHRDGMRAFELKELAGEVALIPAYLFQARGEMLTKPQAIARADEWFSPSALKALEWATFLREAFAPLLKHPRIRLLKRLARRTCPRRHQAEAIMRRWSPWVANHHPLGVNPEVRAAIQRLVAECQSALEVLPP